MNKNHIPLAVFVVGVVVLGIFFALHNKASAPTTATTATTTEVTATTTNGGSATVSATGNPTITITQQSGATAPVAPSLDRPQTFAANVSPDVVAQLKTDEAANIAAIKKTPTDANSWLQLAIDYKIAGDYAGAEAIWVYLTKAVPTDYVPFTNLGDLYTNYLKDNTKAVASYKEAITLKPTYIDNYRNLYYLYIAEGNTTAAKALVAQGLAANPGNPDLMALQTQ